MRFEVALAAGATLAAAVQKPLPLPKRTVYNPQSFILGDGGAVCYEGTRKDMEAWLFALTKEKSTSEFFSKAQVAEGSCNLRDYATPVDMDEGATRCGHRVTTYLDRDMGHQKIWLKMEAKKKAASAIDMMCKEAFEYWQDPEIEAELKDKSDSGRSMVADLVPGEPNNLPSPEVMAAMVQNAGVKARNLNSARRIKRWADEFAANHTREKELERWHAKQDAARERARKMLETAKHDVAGWGGLPSAMERAMKNVHDKVQECLQKWFMIHGDEQPSPDAIKQCYSTVDEDDLPFPAQKTKAAQDKSGNPVRSASDSLADKLKAAAAPRKEMTKKEMMTEIGKGIEQGFKDMFAPKKKGEPLQATPEKAVDDLFKALQQAKDAGLISDPKPLPWAKKPKSKPEDPKDSQKLPDQAQQVKSLKDLAEAMKQFPSPPMVAADSSRAKIVKKMAGNMEVGQLERSKRPGAMGDHPQAEVVREALESIPGSYERTMKAMEPAKELHSEAEFRKAIGRALASGLRTRYMESPATSQGGVLNLARREGAGLHDSGAGVSQQEQVQEVKAVAGEADEQEAAAKQEQAQRSHDALAAMRQAAKAFYEEALAGRHPETSTEHGRWRDKTAGSALTTYGRLRHDGSFDGSIFGSYAGAGVHADIGSSKNSTHRRVKLGGAAGSRLGSLSRHLAGEFPISGASEGQPAAMAVSTDNELKVLGNSPVTFRDELRSMPFRQGERGYQGSATLAVPGTSVSGTMGVVKSGETGSLGKIEARVDTPGYSGPFLFHLGFGDPRQV